jgi:hypothetical protein
MRRRAAHFGYRLVLAKTLVDDLPHQVVVSPGVAAEPWSPASIGQSLLQRSRKFLPDRGFGSALNRVGHIIEFSRP